MHKNPVLASCCHERTRASVSPPNLVKSKRPEWPDRLSNWVLPPPSARAVGEGEPVRVGLADEAVKTAEESIQWLTAISP
jgi:hypothetical protein